VEAGSHFSKAKAVLDKLVPKLLLTAIPTMFRLVLG
jgi:hypothetical protein